jgi:hypothetical protein
MDSNKIGKQNLSITFSFKEMQNVEKYETI